MGSLSAFDIPQEFVSLAVDSDGKWSRWPNPFKSPEMYCFSAGRCVRPGTYTSTKVKGFTLVSSQGDPKCYLVVFGTP